MAKKPVKKSTKKRASKYEEKIIVNMSFDKLLKKALTTPKKKD